MKKNKKPLLWFIIIAAIIAVFIWLYYFDTNCIIYQYDTAKYWQCRHYMPDDCLTQGNSCITDTDCGSIGKCQSFSNTNGSKYCVCPVMGSN